MKETTESTAGASGATEPTPDNPALYFPTGNQAYFRTKRPHQRARLVRIAQVREEMTRVYNYMLRGFYTKYAQLQRDDAAEHARAFPEGFTLAADQAKACTAVLKEIAALVNTQAIEAKLDLLKQRIADIVKAQGLPPPDFTNGEPELAADGEPWAGDRIEAEEPTIIEMEQANEPG